MIKNNAPKFYQILDILFELHAEQYQNYRNFC